MGALGTDTGGSIRNPASFCGIAGLMPTYGRVSRKGVIPYSFSLDHCGPMAWTAEDCAIMLQAIAAYDPGDPGSADLPVPNYTADLNMGIRGMRIGVIRHFYESHLPPEDETRRAFETALQELTKLGALLEEVKLRELEDYDDCKVIISEAEFFAVHEKDLLERFQDYGANLRFRAVPGGLIRAVDYIQAQRQRAKLVAEMQTLFAGYDAMATLCTYGPAPKMSMDEPTHFFQRPNLTAVFNVPATRRFPSAPDLIGWACRSPCKSSARPFAEATILRIAHAYEQATPWRHHRPALPSKTVIGMPASNLIDVMLTKRRSLEVSGGTKVETLNFGTPRRLYEQSLCRAEGFLSGEGREIFVSKLRERIIQSALGHSQLDAHLGKSNTDGFCVQHRDAYLSF